MTRLYTITYAIRWEVTVYGTLPRTNESQVYESPADVAMAVAKALDEGANRVEVTRRETPV